VGQDRFTQFAGVNIFDIKEAHLSRQSKNNIIEHDRREAARRGRRYNHQRVQKRPKFKKIDTHARTHARTHTHTNTHTHKKKKQQKTTKKKQKKNNNKISL